MKVTIKSDGSEGGTRVDVDGHELKMIERVVFIHRAGSVPKLVLVMHASDLELESQNAEGRFTTVVDEVS